MKAKSPMQMSFAEWELVLSSGNQQAADTVWNAIKGKAVKLQASVISATATNVKLAGSDDDIEAKKPRYLRLTMAQADTGKADAAAGAMMAFPGHGDELHADPVHDDYDGRRAAGQERQSGLQCGCVRASTRPRTTANN